MRGTKGYIPVPAHFSSTTLSEQLRTFQDSLWCFQDSRAFCILLYTSHFTSAGLEASEERVHLIAQAQELLLVAARARVPLLRARERQHREGARHAPHLRTGCEWSFTAVWVVRCSLFPATFRTLGYSVLTLKLDLGPALRNSAAPTTAPTGASSPSSSSRARLAPSALPFALRAALAAAAHARTPVRRRAARDQAYLSRRLTLGGTTKPPMALRKLPLLPLSSPETPKHPETPLS